LVYQYGSNLVFYELNLAITFSVKLKNKLINQIFCLDSILLNLIYLISLRKNFPMKNKYKIVIFFLFAACFVQAQVNLTMGLVAQYDFTNQSLTDLGPNFLDLTNSNGATPVADRFGNPDFAYQFDGIDDFMSTPYNPVLSLGFGATISMWVNLSDVTPNQVLLGNMSTPPFGQDGGYLISVVNGQVVFDAWVGSIAPTLQYTLTAGNVAPNQWTNIAVTFMSAQPNNYIVLHQDGQVIDSTFVSDQLGTNTNDLVIGAATWSTDTLLTNGMIDDIKIYNRRINNEEITAIFNEVVTGVNHLEPNRITYFNNYNGSFTVNTKSEQRINQILVTDACGRLIQQLRSFGTQSEIIDLSNAAKGIYYAVIQTNTGTEIIKLVN
jgi:hypothetical protein